MNVRPKTVAEYAKDATIYHVKRKSGKCPSTWKLYPAKDMRDNLVDYVFSFLTTPEGNHCFIIKQKCYGNDLYLINASKFRQTCPNSYAEFYNSIDSYNSLLSDLSATIEDQKKVVEECFNSEILRPYKTNSFVDTSKLPDSEDAQNAMAEIRRLFFLELEYEMAVFLRTNIYSGNELYIFVDNFYNNRDQAFAIINKEDVLNTYRALFLDIINQS